MIRSALINLLTILAISGCCTTGGQVPIPVPPDPVYPHLTKEQAIAFRDWNPAIFEIIGRREKIQAARIERLEGLIETYNREVKK